LTRRHPPIRLTTPVYPSRLARTLNVCPPAYRQASRRPRSSRLEPENLSARRPFTLCVVPRRTVDQSEATVPPQFNNHKQVPRPPHTPAASFKRLLRKCPPRHPALRVKRLFRSSRGIRVPQVGERVGGQRVRRGGGSK